VGRLAGGMAHDLNNILMAIIGYSNLAELELNEDSPAARHLQKILASANRAVELTKSLLAFSRRQPIALEPVNLNELINRMELLIVKLTGEVITYKFQHTLKKCVVMADSDKLEQVLINLITNAKDAMPGGGTLTIATDIVTLDNERAKLYGLGSAGSYILISVSDTGIGMDEETKEKIFEPFFTTKEKGRGTGLGLSIAYGIIKQLNGHIEVMSEPNRGTTFHIYLPETKNEITKTGTEAPKNTPAVNTSGKTILLAEDEAAVREVVTKILEKKGYTVIPAIDGEDAVNKFTEHKDSIDMLLFDVMMPKKNGKEAYDIIKQARPGIKVLFMSGYSEHVATNKNIHEEGLYFLQKPVIPDKLANKISEIIAC
jgi:CheY-like chemotaxis protein